MSDSGRPPIEPLPPEVVFRLDVTERGVMFSFNQPMTREKVAQSLRDIALAFEAGGGSLVWEVGDQN